MFFDNVTANPLFSPGKWGYDEAEHDKYGTSIPAAILIFRKEKTDNQVLV